MSYLSFDEKAWDKIRPFTVKKTGVSEAIRAVEAAVPKQASDLLTEAGCNAAVDALDTLAQKLTGAKVKLDAKKHAEAIKKLVAWSSEVATRRKAMASQSTELRDTYETAIQEADKAVTPFFKLAEEAEEDVRAALVEIQGKAKAALLAGTRGDTEALLQYKEFADSAKKDLLALLKHAESLADKADLAAKSKWPAHALLSENQKRGYVNTLDRVHMIKYKGANLRDYLEPFADAYDIIVMASTKGEGLHDKFAKLVSSDTDELGRLASAMGSIESNTGVIVEKVKQFLDQASEPQVEPNAKLQMLAAAGLQLKEGIGNHQRLSLAADKLAKAVQTRRSAYPEFVTPDDKAFGPSLKRIADIDSFAKDTVEKSIPALSEQFKKLGLRLAQLKG